MRAIVGKESPDVLLLYNLTQESLLSLRAPVVFDVADDLPAMLRVEARFAGRVTEANGRRALARMVRGAALVTTPSRVLLPRLGPDAVFVPNGVDRGEILSARRAGALPGKLTGRSGFSARSSTSSSSIWFSVSRRDCPRGASS